MVVVCVWVVVVVVRRVGGSGSGGVCVWVGERGMWGEGVAYDGYIRAKKMWVKN